MKSFDLDTSDAARTRRTDGILKNAKENCGKTNFQRTCNEVQRLHSILSIAQNGWTDEEREILIALIKDKKIAMRLNEIYNNCGL